MNHGERHRDEHQRDNNEQRNLRVFRYRLYRGRQGVKAYFITLWWDLRHKLKKVDFLVQGLGVAVLVVYTAYTVQMFKANRESADAAKSAANTAAAALELESRPFMTILQPRLSSMQIRNDGGIDSGVVVDAQSVGKSPARDVVILPIFGSGFPAEIKTLCDKATLSPGSGPLGQVIFPGNTTMPPNTNRSVMGNAMRFPFEPRTFYFPAELTICVAYKSLFSGKPYYTGFSYNITYITEKGASLGVKFGENREDEQSAFRSATDQVFSVDPKDVRFSLAWSIAK